jgi:import inner membrane translocase subunit TIM10
MSMFGGFGRPQPSSAEKIAAAEAEMDLVTQMFNKYGLFLPLQGCSLDIR